jgi:hypothetical protein
VIDGDSNLLKSSTLFFDFYPKQLLMTQSINSMAQITDLNTIFLCDYWTEEHCNLNNWKVAPSDFEIKGVHLVGPPHMKSWSDLSHWHNPGRAKGVNTGKVEQIVEDIRENGIDMSSTIVYYDIDTQERVNGAHRQMAAEKLNIPGWMMQAVRFDGKGCKIDFATRSNNVRVPIATRPTIDDITSAIQELINEDYFENEKEIRDTIRAYAKGHLSNGVQSEIYNNIISSNVFSGNRKFSKVMRYVAFNDEIFNKFMENTNDPWIDDYYENEYEHTLYVNTDYFAARIGTILKEADTARKNGKPLHFVFSVSAPNAKGQETLQTKRQKVFSQALQQLENNICGSLGMDSDAFRSILPWNHKDAQHRFVPQDSVCENLSELIPAKDI